MYAKRIQIRNYGPIDHVDITLPFANGDENPKPVLLVGENGSGKSIFLSHIVDGLMMAQGVIYPENSEVELGKVYKFRSPSYIKSGKDYYWVQTDFEKWLKFEELQLRMNKKEFSAKPDGWVGGDMDGLWDSMSEDASVAGKNLTNRRRSGDRQYVREIFDVNSILYFPHNRFEDPAWLNEYNLKSNAHYMDLRHIEGYADRKIICHSPLHDNKNWLFEVLFDQYAFETHTLQVPLDVKDEMGNPKKIPLPVVGGHKGVATDIYKAVLDIVRIVFRVGEELRFGIGQRQNRFVSLMRCNRAIVPNIFQLSSGQTALLNLFLSILRDFDLSRTPFTGVEYIRGIVVVDEIDLHLHAIHQHEVLPKLMKMFPRVQFIVTTHSPLFVLGMEKVFGEDCFALYRLPEGQHISPEEFSEFGSAYRAFTETKKFTDDIKARIANAQKPVVFVEGRTDTKYLQKAAELLGRNAVLECVELMEAGGSSNLAKIWNSKFAEAVMTPKVLLLYDCDNQGLNDCDKGGMSRRKIPARENHPLEKGIENLFERATLERARQDKPAYIDIEYAHSMTERGQEKNVPEKWSVNADEKTNLCDWLCEHCTPDDFKHFVVVFDIIEEALGRGE